MAKLTFTGGIHPYDGKDLSKDKPIVDILPKGDLVYPLSQHIGAPAVPGVKTGDTVLMGQKIAEAGGYVSANIHSSVSGTVTTASAGASTRIIAEVDSTSTVPSTIFRDSVPAVVLLT